MKTIPYTLSKKTVEPPTHVPLPGTREHAFTFSRFMEDRFHGDLHYHNAVELVWIRRGTGLRFLGDSVEPFSDGDLILVGPNVPHAWRSTSEQSGDADWSVIQFLPERWGDLFWEMAEADGLLKLINRARGGLRFTGAEIQKIGDLIESLGNTPPCSFEGLSLFMQICRHLLATETRLVNAQAAGTTGGCNDPRLKRTLALIDNLSQDHLSQAHMAKELNMSAATFSRWFKQHMGRTFQRYLNEVRVARVCAELAQGQDNITSVAMNSGYHNLANFNRRFREIMGITPKAFRTQARPPSGASYGRLMTNRYDRLLATSGAAGR